MNQCPLCFLRCHNEHKYSHTRTYHSPDKFGKTQKLQVLVNFAPVRDFVYLASICYLTGELCVVGVSSESVSSIFKTLLAFSFVFATVIALLSLIMLSNVKVVEFCVLMHVNRNRITVFDKYQIK